MLTDEDFCAWCQRNQIGSETQTAIQRIRTSPPSRKVRSRTSNVSGRYPSVKMGCSIQFESQNELWGIYTMERDDDVLEFYDQPTRIQLHYHARSGHKTSPWHTPDFLVIRRDGAGFEEWKPTDALDKLAERQPERYQRNRTGGWLCPPGERAAQALGLSYRVRTSAEYHSLYIQNLKLLQDFWTHPFRLPAQTEAQVLDALRVYPGMSVAAFLDAHSGIAIDAIFALLTSQRIFTDLSAASLMDWDQVLLYLSVEDVEAAKQANKPVESRSLLPSPLIFDGRLWESERENATVLLRPEVGAVFTLTASQFQRLVELGHIKQIERASPSPLQDAARERLAHAGPKALEAANRRWREILAYIRGEAITVTPRSVQNWMAAYRQAEADAGCGYVGLLDRVASRGNRTPRVPEASRELLEAYLTTHYAAPQGKRAAAVYRLYREEAIRQGIPPIGERTFYYERARFDDQSVTTVRRGKRAAYASQPFLGYLDRTIM